MAKKQKESESKIILVKCKAADYIPWKSIKPLQGNYKKRSKSDVEKLAKLIIKRGIRAPSQVTKLGADVWAIDTHGRLLAYEWLEKEGWSIPNIPVNWIETKSIADAKQTLLEFDSRYGKVTKEGYEEFIQDFEVEKEYLSLSDIRIESEETKAITYKERVELIVECMDESQAEILYGEFKKRGLKCRISTL